MIWVLWFLLLVAQNASFTLVSRARNSKSLGYHAWAAVLSNGIWFASQFILVDTFMRIIRSGDIVAGLTAALVYTAGTMVGSLGMHWIALRHIETRVKA
jgi:hypothetical protein